MPLPRWAATQKLLFGDDPTVEGTQGATYLPNWAPACLPYPDADELPVRARLDALDATSGEEATS